MVFNTVSTTAPEHALLFSSYHHWMSVVTMHSMQFQIVCKPLKVLLSGSSQTSAYWLRFSFNKEILRALLGFQGLIRATVHYLLFPTAVSLVQIILLCLKLCIWRILRHFICVDPMFHSHTSKCWDCKPCGLPSWCGMSTWCSPRLSLSAWSVLRIPAQCVFFISIISQLYTIPKGIHMCHWPRNYTKQYGNCHCSIENTTLTWLLIVYFVSLV